MKLSARVKWKLKGYYLKSKVNIKSEENVILRTFLLGISKGLRVLSWFFFLSNKKR